MSGTMGSVSAPVEEGVPPRETRSATALREALRAGDRDALLRTLADVVHAAICIKDREGRYLFVNRHAEELFQRDAEDIIGHRDDEIFGAEVARCIREHDLRVLEAGMPVDAEASLPHRDGSMHVYRNMSVPLMPEGSAGDDRPWGLCGVWTDITPQKQGVALLEQAVQERERVLRVVSHDLKTPLTALRIGLGALRRQVVRSDDDTRRHLDLLDRAITRMQRLISDVLDATRSEQGRLPVVLRPADVGDVLREAAEGHQLAASPRQIRLTVHPPIGESVIRCDPERVLQVLANLLDNALRFSPPGAEVQLRSEGRGESVCIMVDDEGPGVAKEDREAIFSPYTSAPGPDGHASTGLGLYIARNLIEAQGGRIWVESAPTGGARFAFTLPVWHPGAAEPA